MIIGTCFGYTLILTSDGDIETCSHAFLSCCDDFIEKLCLRNVLNGNENCILGRPKETFSLFAPLVSEKWM